MVDELHTGVVAFVVPVRVAAGVGTSATTVRVKFQLCSERLCAPPQSIALPITFNVRAKRAGR